MILGILSAFALLTALVCSQSWMLAWETSTDAAEIERLIGQLGNVKFTEREAASKRLDAIGEPALPALRKALATSQDAEIRRRARQAIQAISQRVFARVKPVIGQLGSEKFSEREAASKRLDAIGELALPGLRQAAATSNDAEIRHRARNLI